MAIDTKRKSGLIDSMLNEDLLAQILNKVSRKEDRMSFSEVCKQWLRVERLSRTLLRVYRPKTPLVLQRLLTKFPNLVDFRTWELTELRRRQNKQAWYYPPTDNRLEVIAQACPKLETFMVCFYDDVDVQDDGHLGTKGLRALGNGCPKLSTVLFDGRRVIGNCGVDALFQSAHNLKSLHLFRNDLVSDHAFRTIGSSSISTLVLGYCREVTDVGLGFLANGSTSKTLKKLIIAGSCKFSDAGIHLLVKLSSLEHLELDGLSFKVTHIGVVAISGIQTLRKLKVSDIDGVSDQTVVALAENCRNLEALCLRCDFRKPLSGASIHAFSSHKSLKHLALFCRIDLDQSDVERVLAECPSLESLVLHESLINKSLAMMRENSARARSVVKYGWAEYAYFSTFMATTWYKDSI